MRSNLFKLAYEDMCLMEVNQIHRSTGGDLVRVPGGWLYVLKVPSGGKTFYQSPVFVPEVHQSEKGECQCKK